MTSATSLGFESDASESETNNSRKEFLVESNPVKTTTVDATPRL